MNNDTFLKVFDQNIQDTKLKPKDPNILESHAKISLNHSKYNLSGGFTVYENLEKRAVIGISIYYLILILTKTFQIIF